MSTIINGRRRGRISYAQLRERPGAFHGGQLVTFVTEHRTTMGRKQGLEYIGTIYRVVLPGVTWREAAPDAERLWDCSLVWKLGTKTRDHISYLILRLGDPFYGISCPTLHWPRARTVKSCTETGSVGDVDENGIPLEWSERDAAIAAKIRQSPLWVEPTAQATPVSDIHNPPALLRTAST